MGLFKRKPKPEELAAKEENKKLLADFTPTKAIGVKKVNVGMLFIYDEEKKRFVVVQGPEATFKEREPWVVGFDQVEDVYVEVEEKWCEDDNKFSIGSTRNILMGDYDKVFWQYDIYLTIDTSHPHAKKIKYKMNFDKIITQVRGRFPFNAPRGLECNGRFQGKELKDEVARLKEVAVIQENNVKNGRFVDVLTGNRPDGIIDRIINDGLEDRNVKRMMHVVTHLKRAYAIEKLLTK